MVDLPFYPSNLTTTTISGHSMLRELFLQKFIERGLSRPQYNLERNKNN
jgi:hypothetical protein